MANAFVRRYASSTDARPTTDSARDINFWRSALSDDSRRADVKLRSSSTASKSAAPACSFKHRAQQTPERAHVAPERRLLLDAPARAVNSSSRARWSSTSHKRSSSPTPFSSLSV